MIKLYFYPPKVPNKRDIVKNPYTTNFMDALSNHCEVINKNSIAKISILDLCKNIFKFDYIIFNWIESIGTRKAGGFQFILFFCILIILKIRKVKIVWILHNIHPHQGEKNISKWTKELMFKNSNLIVTHSKDAEKYARTKALNEVIFCHHPISTNLINVVDKKPKKNVTKYDFLIWGSVEPYKGILEFLHYIKNNDKNWKIKIVGKCKDATYESQIKRYVSKFISYENRLIPFSEISELIGVSKYVLFPYKSTSVSSSGALMDTLVLKGNIIGPARGAFNDLAEENICSVFTNYDDISNILTNELPIKQNVVMNFISKNSWMNFSEKIIDKIKII